MSKFVTLADYKPSKGAPFKGRSQTQLAGYVPSEKRASDLLMAGLIRQAHADSWYDSQFDYKDVDELPPVPPIPRAFPSSIEEVSMVARELKERTKIINDRVRLAAEKGQRLPSGGLPSGGVQPSAGQGVAPPGGEAPPGGSKAP